MPTLRKSSAKTSALERVRFLGHLLDNAIPIPGTNRRIGLDPLLGLLPGGGDVVGMVLSAYIVVESARMGVPRELLVKMVSNILLDSVVGAIPLLGDLFDVAWKANSRNLVLLESHVGGPVPPARRPPNPKFMLGLILAVIGVVVVAALAIAGIVGLVLHLLRI
jgi:Domain of unknown function (DUF4112)